MKILNIFAKASRQENIDRESDTVDHHFSPPLPLHTEMKRYKSKSRHLVGAIYINFDIDGGMVIMAKNNKTSKGPQDRNSNFQMKNGNPVSKKKEKKSKPTETKSAAQTKPAEQKSFISGISSSITNATNSISKMFKH